jgi:hypothetical protein
MAPKTQLALSFIASAALVATAASAQLVQEGGRPFTVQMNGHNEVNAAGTFDQGDLDGTGTARLMLNYGQGRVCYEITVSNIATPTAAHIHEAPPTLPGPIVVPLFTTSGTTMKGCVEAGQDLIKEIIQNPQDYYVNVHNADFPAGAIRGQISKKKPD